MRQVPPNYLIIGRGRLATHLARYFALERIPFQRWTRDNTSHDLHELLPDAQRVLLAIKDDAIEPFILKHHLSPLKTLHFSGALQTPLAPSAHPLMTFSVDDYTHEEYKRIPFVTEHGQPTLKELLPELANPHYVIPADQRGLYHALCVLGGNGSVAIWQKVLALFSEKLGLPPQALAPYLEQVFKNLSRHPESALTGPWVRGDFQTIQKNKKALEQTDLLPVYKALSQLFEFPRIQPSPPQRSLP